ncbi:5-oxoprolinase subunit C family protein [Helicobacter bizzozeronii]|uniref:5-oxoprolinase subunit C family protein n=1 Tax=Helicobacter bizzozeronii TaxID=56877 RepID=UPI000CF11B25|nr:biotin-dependent carboxyltransferase family protein [Helicobacter bizzozeronii]
MSSIRVLQGGLCTTIQDLGRLGYARFGIPAAGVMDEFSASVANFLVGNSREYALLEMHYVGACLEFLEPMHIAIGGANLSPKINDCVVFNWESYVVKPGDILSFGIPQSGVCAYVAVSGVLDVPSVHGSKSTYMHAQMGGFWGRKLQKGDLLSVQVRPENKKRHLAEHYRPLYHAHASLPVILGPQDSCFSEQTIRQFCQTPYQISKGDRMGIFLEGPSLEWHTHAEIISEPLVVGSVQVPSNGKPIVLMADRQTMGGYPKIATLTKESLVTLAQMRPRDEVHFVPYSIEHAQERYRAFYQHLEHIVASLA